MSQITKIVLTGGPCAGKTTALAKIVQYFTYRGFAVLCNINECHPDLEEEIIDAVEFYYDDYSDLRDNWEN